MPFLVTDPQAGVDHFRVTLDGEVLLVDAEVSGDAGRLHYDVSEVSTGSHTATVEAGNMWGYAPPTDPFDFEKQLPSQASGLGLEP